MTPERQQHFQENLWLNNYTPEQLEKVKTELKEKIDTLKADGSFSGEDLKELVDLLDDKTILSPTEAELKSHLETLNDLNNQIDFLMALVEIWEGKSDENVEKNLDNTWWENWINNIIIEKILKWEEINWWNPKINLTESLKNFLLKPNEKSFNLLNNNEKSESLGIIILLIENNSTNIPNNDLLWIFKNDFFKNNYKNNEIESIEIFEAISFYLEERWILDDVVKLLWIEKSKILESENYSNLKYEKDLKDNNIELSDLNINDLKNKDKIKLILNSYKFNWAWYLFYHIKENDILRILYEETIKIDEIKNNKNYIEDIIDWISKNINIDIKEKNKYPWVKERIYKNLYLEMWSYDSSKNPEEELKKIFNIENPNIEENYKNLFSISNSRDLINAIDSIFKNKEFFNEKLFIKYVNPDALDLDSLEKINLFYKWNIPKEILLKIPEETINYITDSFKEYKENWEIKLGLNLINRFKNITWYWKDNLRNQIIKNLFNNKKDFFKDLFEENNYFIKKNEYNEFNEENLNKFLSTEWNNINDLKLNFWNNITDNFFKESFNILEDSPFKKFICENIKKFPEQILSFDILTNNNLIVQILLQENPKIIKYIPENIRSDEKFINIAMSLKNIDKIVQYLVFNEKNLKILLELILLEKEHFSRNINDISNIKIKNLKKIIEAKEPILIEKWKKIRWLLENFKQDKDINIRKITEELIQSIDQKIYENQLNEIDKNEKYDLKNLDEKIKKIWIIDKKEIEAVKNFLTNTNNNVAFSNMISILWEKWNRETIFKIFDILKELKIKENSEKSKWLEDVINIYLNSWKNIPQKFEIYIIKDKDWKKSLNKNKLITDFSDWSSKPENQKNNHLEIINPETFEIDSIIDISKLNFLAKIWIDKNNELYTYLENLIHIEDEKRNIQNMDYKKLHFHLMNWWSIESYIEEIKKEKENSKILETNNSQENIINNSSKDKKNIENWILEKDWKKITLTQEEIKIIQKSPETAENIINLYESLEKVWLSKLWNFRENIFKSIENTFNFQFDRKDWNYLDERETKILLNSILVSIWEQPLKTTLNMEAFLTEIENRNWKQITWTEKQINNYSETKFENLFIEKFVWRWDMIWFKQSAFEASLK